MHLLLLHPSPALWARVEHLTRRRAAGLRRALTTGRRSTRAQPSARLLGARRRASCSSCSPAAPSSSGDPSSPRSADEPPATLLGALQADIRADRRPPGAPLPGEPDRRLGSTADDRSVQIHACHGRARQVEVLREAILHRLADDPTLEPRDVIVMCPDIETFAPLIQATFGTRARRRRRRRPRSSDGPTLRVRLADRSLRRTNPVLGVVARLLELALERG